MSKLRELLNQPKVRAYRDQLRYDKLMQNPAVQSYAAAKVFGNVVPMPPPEPRFPKKLTAEWGEDGKLQAFAIDGEEVLIEREGGRIKSVRIGDQELVPAYAKDGLMKSLQVGGEEFTVTRSKKRGLVQEIGNGRLVFKVHRNEKGNIADIVGRVVNE